VVSLSTQNVVAEELYERLVKDFMEVIVLKELRKGNPLGAYDIIFLVRKGFHILLSSGTVSSLLYSMERDGLIDGVIDGNKRVYRLTERGGETLENVSEDSEKLIWLLKSILEK